MSPTRDSVGRPDKKGKKTVRKRNQEKYAKTCLCQYYRIRKAVENWYTKARPSIFMPPDFAFAAAAALLFGAISGLFGSTLGKSRKKSAQEMNDSGH